MLAKEAKKIIENHLKGVQTASSKRIVAEICKGLESAGYKPPFRIAYLITPETEEFSSQMSQEKEENNGIHSEPLGKKTKKKKKIKPKMVEPFKA